MEKTVTALEMRKKLGSILDQVAHEGEHITIMRGNRPLATLIPAKEHEEQCGSRNRVRTLEVALQRLEDWKKKNPDTVRELSKKDAASLVRDMRQNRWSSSTPQSR